MTYTIDEAAQLLDLSYSAVYRYVKDHSLGGTERNKELTPADLEFIREQRYLARKRRSKTFRLEEKIEQLEADIARLDFELESLERRIK
jgi:transposase